MIPLIRIRPLVPCCLSLLSTILLSGQRNGIVEMIQRARLGLWMQLSAVTLQWRTARQTVYSFRHQRPTLHFIPSQNLRTPPFRARNSSIVLIYRSTLPQASYSQSYICSVFVSTSTRVYHSTNCSSWTTTFVQVSDLSTR